VLCEDDELLRTLVGKLLTDGGHEVVGEAGEADVALHMLPRVQPDVVVVDLALRRGSGRDVMEAARKLGCTAVVFSAFAEGITAPPGMAVVPKPDFDALLAAVNGRADRGDQSRDKRPDRRSRSRRSADGTPPATPPGAIDEPEVFFRTLADGSPSDALMSVRPATGDGESAADLAALVRTIVRADDHVTQKGDEVLALLLDAGVDGAPAVVNRLERASLGGTEAVTRHVAIAEAGSPSDAYRVLRAEHLAAAQIAAEARAIAEAEERDAAGARAAAAAWAEAREAAEVWAEEQAAAEARAIAEAEAREAAAREAAEAQATAEAEEREAAERAAAQARAIADAEAQRAAAEARAVAEARAAEERETRERETAWRAALAAANDEDPAEAVVMSQGPEFDGDLAVFADRIEWRGRSGYRRNGTDVVGLETLRSLTVLRDSLLHSKVTFDFDGVSRSARLRHSDARLLAEAVAAATERAGRTAKFESPRPAPTRAAPRNPRPRAGGASGGR
jgi:CheY-like chemotaxis protein